MSAVLVTEFTVDGIPVAQGSKSGYPLGGRVRIVDSNQKTLRPWRATVAAAAIAAHSGDQVVGPVQLVAEFAFVRPPSVSVKKRPLPAVKPDLDKLLRALLDGITDSGIWHDDAQVVTVLASKVYADRPHVRVQLGEYQATPNPKKRESNDE